MSRKKRKLRRVPLKADTKHNSLEVAKFINMVMLDGKKVKAQNIVYKAMELLSQKVEASELDAFNQALQNIMPKMEVKSRRVGGSTYQVPMEVRKARALSLAMRWVISFSRSRKEHSMIEKLGLELTDAYNKVGLTIKKREDTHKMAEANKAFAHFKY